MDSTGATKMYPGNALGLSSNGYKVRKIKTEQVTVAHRVTFVLRRISRPV